VALSLIGALTLSLGQVSGVWRKTHEELESALTNLQEYRFLLKALGSLEDQVFLPYWWDPEEPYQWEKKEARFSYFRGIKDDEFIIK